MIKSVDQETLNLFFTVTIFVTLCKLYNVFIAKEMETYSDVDIAKMCLLGVAAMYLSKLLLRSVLQPQPTPLDAVPAAPPPPTPQLSKIVR